MAGCFASPLARPAAVLGGIASLFLAGVAQAQSLNVEIDRLTRVAVHGAVASVIVGNPAIADVTVVDANTLFVTGKGYGVTEVVAVDRAGRTVYESEVVVTGGSGVAVRVWRGAEDKEVICAASCWTSTRE
ncbi:pilus assembly protein CpaC [Brevundimonas sp. LM2]|uniref:pilus assembly protein N-terminal domain-containing protein n=1 Tax=Brevundimonas sp. LM2 TaxID=1938605 RepID=UPI00098396F7|nr:pilus assembly protein N-terminal domain-containing protein [Brevundimonas sp. LM2]AQR63327.1 pilus assembly protein CpaC [Brevundimonas sp. LM2]